MESIRWVFRVYGEEFIGELKGKRCFWDRVVMGERSTGCFFYYLF